MSYPGATTYNCPHCGKPFTVQPTGQAQQISCPSCRGQVTIGPQQPQVSQAPIPLPIQPQQPPVQTPKPMPPSQQPQYQQPAQPATRPAPPVTQQPQPRPQARPQPQPQARPQPRPQPQPQARPQPQPQYQPQPQPQYQPQPQPQYQTPYTQPPAQAPATPPKKSKKRVVIAVICVVAILVIAMLAYLFVLAPGEEEIPTITYEELNADLDVDLTSMSVTFKSYDDGDKLNVVGTVQDIRIVDVPPGNVLVSSGTWTIIFFGGEGALPVYNMFAYKGDLGSKYTIGEEATIRIRIDRISAFGIIMEYPEEYMTASQITAYIEIPNITLEFTETSPGNYTGSVTSSSDSILLSNLDIEIYDSSASSYGYDDGDLTDNDPEEIDTWFGDLLLEFRDVNDNGRLDSLDTFTVYYAGSGDEIELIDTFSYETITVYIIT